MPDPRTAGAAKSDYRYIGVDLLTRTIVEDLPLYGVNMTRKINGAGNFTGTYKLHTSDASDLDLMSASKPGLRAILVLRNQWPVWMGPIWSCTYSSIGNTMELSAQTYESVFAKIKMLSRFNQVNVDQGLIFKMLIDAMQAQASSNFGLDTSQINTNTGVLSSTTVETYEHRMYDGPMGDLLKAANSFDWMVNYTFDTNTNNITLPVRLGYPMLGYGQYGIDLDFPGSIYSYYYPENASRGVVSTTALGAGEGTSMLAAMWDNPDLLNAGYPAWAGVDSQHKSIDNLNMIQRIALEAGQTAAIPVSIPTVEIRLGSDQDDSAIHFAEWANLGTPINLNIQDERFPNGMTARHRMLGWSLTPPDATSIETISLTLEGQDSAA